MDSAMDILDASFPIIHAVIFTIGVVNNVSLLLASFLRTPKMLKNYSIIIKFETFNDLFAVLDPSLLHSRDTEQSKAFVSLQAQTVHAMLPPITIIGVCIYLVGFFDIYKHAALEKAILALRYIFPGTFYSYN
ncbi:hypothetical protein PRIPAC_90009 [Pristionchus pacificus]|uniref:G protein-coupled receptor n=1 Tax=Pristionchus pacificus TaxID=54126 RepID=A0A2A6B8R6_PRIPA|nr:hypothetical protein PRIPAC_90009 [Pristionchus pacificus]|eukprot:PDM62272.1 G protein-coupled receptor [Pristionchus pacificus]